MLGLLVDFVNGRDLRRGTLQLHLVDTADARQRAVQVLHLLGVARQALALLRHLRQHLRQPVQLVNVVRGSLLQLIAHGQRLWLLRIRHDATATGKADRTTLPAGSLITISDHVADLGTTAINNDSPATNDAPAYDATTG